MHVIGYFIIWKIFPFRFNIFYKFISLIYHRFTINYYWYGKVYLQSLSYFILIIIYLLYSGVTRKSWVGGRRPTLLQNDSTMLGQRKCLCIYLIFFPIVVWTETLCEGPLPTHTSFRYATTNIVIKNLLFKNYLWVGAHLGYATTIIYTGWVIMIAPVSILRISQHKSII